ncbi:hypothetical protein Q7P35_004075 [Cladosporium inversicolor]
MTTRSSWVRRVNALKRQASGNAIQAASNPLEAGTAGQTAQTLTATAPANTYLYLGVGIGVGGALLIACALIIVQIVRKRAEHKRALAEIEHGHTVEVAQVRDLRGDVPRPVSSARAGRLVPTHEKGGWGALGSSEEVNEPDLANHSARKRRSYISIPKRIKQSGIPLRRLKHLSAIIESPRSRSAHSPTPDQQDLPVLPSSNKKPRGTPASTKATHGEALQADDVFLGPPSSPKPTMLPPFAIRSPGRYGVSFVEDSPNKAKRSYSVGALIAPIPDGAVFGSVASEGRPPMHARSISLGAHKAASRPPTGPVPPLPVIAPHNTHATSVRAGFCLSRMSSSSQESASSSVLVTSPILRAPDVNSNSPSLEQIVADDDSASLKQVSHRQWQNPLVAGPRPIPDTSPTVPALNMSHKHKPSVRSNVARYSVDSQLSRQLSTTSVASSLESEKRNRLSIPRLGTADRVSIRSVSSVGSFRNESGVKKITTPRRASRCSTTVSESGSPAEKPKSVLRDISGNAGPPTRQASNATQTSSRSSNGNPFQWDSVPSQKPSALKGSPNARKGHRRQNCVRISTLTPQILGPPPSRPTSPSIMHGIEEEPLDFDGASNTMGGLPFVSNSTHLSRPSSLAAFAPHLRISTLRASLTSSSPTLSSWTTFQDPTSQPLDAMSSRSASPGTTAARSAYRQSGQSSNFSIPYFPSPSETTVTAVQRDQPVPEFYFTRPSTDEPGFDFGWERDDHSAVDVHIPDDIDITSSPPLPVAKEDEYDPTCPMLVIPKRGDAQEYDPASPAFAAPGAEPDKSSPFASTVTFSDDDTRYSRPVSYSEDYQPESPPCSPRSMPQTLGLFSLSSPSDHSNSSTPRGSSPSYEKLTSANASTIMARIRTHSRKVDFPGAPILPPPIDDKPVPFPLTITSRNRSLSTTAGYLQPHRPAPQVPIPLDEKGDVPLSLIPGPRPQYSPTPSDSRRTSASPCGPRDKPPKSVAKQIIALRRMNSEMDTSTSNQSRRYLHGLSREPAPLLPWIGSPGASESCNDMFDFDFEATGGYDARGGADDGEEDDMDPTSALDDVDMSDIERRLEGALAGFDIPPSVDEGVSEEEASSPVALPEQTDDQCGDRASSVWEDGEKFWNRTILSTIPGSSPSDAEKARMVMTPRMYSAGYGLGSRRSHMRSPGVMATPKSLYDADGFLRT